MGLTVVVAVVAIAVGVVVVVKIVAAFATISSAFCKFAGIIGIWVLQLPYDLYSISY